MYMYMHVCVCVCVCVCVWVGVCVYTYRHTHTHVYMKPHTTRQHTYTHRQGTRFGKEQDEDDDSSSRFSQLSLERHPQLQSSERDSASNINLCACETSTHFCVRCGHNVCNFCSEAYEGEDLRRIHRDYGDCFGAGAGPRLQQDRENNQVKLKGE